MAKSKELAVIEKKTLPTVEAIGKLTIKSEKDKSKASVWLSELKAQLKKVEAWRKKKTDPLNELLKIIRAETKPIEDHLNAGIKEVGNKLSDYQTAEVTAAEEEKDRIANRIAPGKGNLSMETAGKQIDEIEKPSTSVATDSGTVKFRPVPKVDIVPLSKTIFAKETNSSILNLIQEGLIVWDEVAVRKFMLANKDAKLPGVTYRVEQRAANY